MPIFCCPKLTLPLIQTTKLKSFIYFQPISSCLQPSPVALNRSTSQDNNVAAKKVITIVDLDDEDDVTPTPTAHQIVIPQGQVRLIPSNHLQQQSQNVAYTVVSNANTGTTMSGGGMGPGVNRLLIARPQQPGQIVLARTGGVPGTAIRQQQVIKCIIL